MCDRNQLLTGLERLGLGISDESATKLLLYCQELQKWNRKINLISRDTPAAESIEKHFLDSLTLLPLLHRYGDAGATLLDVGSGAGFPGLVLAAAAPETQFTLIEPRQKRTAFLWHIVRTLGLANVCVREERLEHGAGLPDAFRFITSRAVAAPALFLPMIEQVAGPETLVILMFAAEGRQSWDTERWPVVDSLSCALPFSGDPRLLTVVRKQP